MRGSGPRCPRSNDLCAMAPKAAGPPIVLGPKGPKVKAAAKVVVVPSTPKAETIHRHPTMSRLQSDLTVLADVMTAIAHVTAKERGGIAVYDQTAYVQAMKKDGLYTCTVKFDYIKPDALVHSGIPPHMGAVDRMTEQFFQDPDGKWCCSGVPETIIVRGTSKSEAPEPGQASPLMGDTYRHAFLHAWAEAVKANDAATAAFGIAAKSWRVTFLCLPDEDKYEQKKWQLSEEAKEASQSQVLTGYKRVLAMVNVRDMLAARSKPHTSEDIAAWMTSARPSVLILL